MMLAPLTEQEAQKIVDQIVAACSNITKLKRRAYQFISLASGFIAHYSNQGFISYYSNASLRDDILRYQYRNQWQNFRSGQEHYEYYKQKGEMYNLICDKLGLMPTFHVDIIWEMYKGVDVIANSMEDAERKVRELYQSQCLPVGEYVVDSFKIEG